MEMRNLVFLMLLLSSMALGAPISYPVPGGTAYRSNTGQIAVDPGDAQQTFQYPTMGMFGNKWIPIKVAADGTVQTSGGGSGSADVNIFDSSGNLLNSTAGALDVSVTSFPGTVSVTQGTSPWVVSGSVSVSNFPATQNVNVVNSSIPVTQSGAWTTGRTWTLSNGTDSVSAVVSNFPTLQQVDLEQIGGATPSATNWVPARVTNGTSFVDPTQIRALTTSDQITAFQGTNPWTVNGTIQAAQSGAWSTGRTWNLTSGSDSVTAVISGTIPISGTVTANQGAPNTLANAWPTEITDGTNVLGTPTNPVRTDPTGTTTQPISGAVTASQGGSWTVAATQSGAWTTGRTWTLSSGTDSVAIGGTVAVTQSTSPWVISGTVTANAGTGNFTVVQASGANLHVDVDNFPATVAVTQSTSPWVVSGTVSVSGTVGVTQSTSPWVVSGTVTSNQGAPNSLANGWPVEVTDGTNVLGTSSHPLRVDPTGATTQPVSGTVSATQGTSPWVVSGTVTANQGGSWTVTANAGTNLNTSALALDTSVNGILLSQGSTTSGEKGPLAQGAVTTSSPSYTTAQTSPLSLTTAGALRVDGSATTQPVSGTVAISGTVGVTQSTSPWVTNVSQFGGTNVSTGTGASGSGIPRVTVSNDSNILATQSGTWTTGRTWTLASGTDSVSAVQSGTWTVQQGTPPWTIQGDSASGSSKAGNPVQIGGVFNTTQPTVTTGQTVEAQSTARGAQIVATGVDAFNVNATQTTSPWVVSGTVTANQGGAWTVTANQGTSPWVSNVSQFGGSNVATGTGASGSGIPRVTVSNDSNILATQSGTWTVQPGNTANTTPWLTTDSSDGPVSAGTVAPKSSLGAAQFNTSLPTLTNAQQVAAQADVNGRLIVSNSPIDGYKASYSAAAVGFVPPAAATDIFTITGSGTKTVRVTRAECTVSTTAGSGVALNAQIVVRSTANSGGTATTVTSVPHDSNSAAGTATVRSYSTTNPTLGTLTGAIRADRGAAVTAGAASETFFWTFGERPAQAIVLRGATQVLAFNLGGTTITGPVADCDVEWTEE